MSLSFRLSLSKYPSYTLSFLPSLNALIANAVTFSILSVNSNEQSNNGSLYCSILSICFLFAVKNVLMLVHVVIVLLQRIRYLRARI